MLITIRLLEPNDAAAYRTLRLNSFQEAPFAFSESYEDEQLGPVEDLAKELIWVGAPPESFVVGAFDEVDQLVGFVTFRRDWRTKARHKGMIHAMYTTPNYREQGIGSKLIGELLQRAKAMPGLEQIHLWVLHANTSATDFYLKCGFQSQGTRVKNDLKIGDRYVDAEYMVLYL